MSRAADYTIQGFLYQFNKTLQEILRSQDTAEVTVEGIIEDIELAAGSVTTAIQCKYHESIQQFAASVLYKPMLQMMQHFQKNPGGKVKYVLFAHFPNPPADGVNKSDFQAALASKNKDLSQYVSELNGKLDLDSFLKHFEVRFGQSFDALVSEVCRALEQAGIPNEDIDTLAYPNAVHTIACLSIKHNVADRKITRQRLIERIKQIKKTAVSRWTLALRSRKRILDARRKQLKTNLDKNSRLRYFVINPASLEDFDSEIVTFVSDYLDKYHFKSAHISTPVFCFQTTEDVFRQVQYRLHQKRIISTDGYVGNYFDEAYCFREPMFRRDARGLHREFSLRILRWATHGTILSQRKADDVFILGAEDSVGLETVDVNVEILGAPSLKEIKYILGVSNAYE